VTLAGITSPAPGASSGMPLRLVPLGRRKRDVRESFEVAEKAE